MAKIYGERCFLMLLPLLGFYESSIPVLFIATIDVSCRSADKEASVTRTVQLRGAGTAYSAAVYSSWTSSYQAMRQQFIDLNMTYTKLTNGEEIEKLQEYNAYGLQYATSDAISKKAFRDNPNLQTFPTMAGAICIVFNLPDSASVSSSSESEIKTLSLSREALVGIFNGSVTQWNDSTISLENPALKLPAQQIRVVARRDSSGTTNLLTSALSRFSSAWSKTYGTFATSTQWNQSVISYYGKRSSGLAGLVTSLPYTIGYVSVADVADMDLNYALLKNRAGYYVDARDVQTLQASMDNYTQVLDEHRMADISDGPGPLNYPILGFTYMSVIKNPTRANCDASEEFLRFANWFLNDDAANDLCIKQNMIPLSQTLADRVTKEVLRKYRCNGKSMWEQAEQRRIQEEQSLQTWRLPVYILVPICIVATLALLGYIAHTWQRQNEAVRQNLFIVPRQKIRLHSKQRNQQRHSPFSSTSAYSLASVGTNGSANTYHLSAATTNSVCSENDDFVSSEYDRHQHQQRQQRKPAAMVREDGGNTEDVELMKVTVANNPQPLGDVTKLAYKTRRLLFVLRDKVAHVNVQRFIGLVTTNENNTQHGNATMLSKNGLNHYLVFDACSKGNMQALIHSNKYDIDGVIKFSLAIDIAAGMEYLHNKHSFVHGQLRTWSCLITSRWQVCISDWEWQPFKQHNTELKRPMYAGKEHIKTQQSNFMPYDSRWLAPEVLAQFIGKTIMFGGQASELTTKSKQNFAFGRSKVHVYPATSSSRVDEQMLVEPTASGDVYSFAIILYEIFEREQPYASYDYDDQALLYDILYKSVRPKWSVTSETVDKKEILKIHAMVASIWQSPADGRPNFQVLHKKLQQINPGGKSSLVDLMMKALDDYATSLEDRVMERTSELQQVTNNMTQLLHRMVPPSIADKLSKGESVLPEGYDSVSVYFSDVVGFTEICANSTPLEIVHLLNNLYTIFDETIDNHDVFKVETIGDSYMLISGLPNRNGIQHAANIATVALKLLSVVMNYHILHKSETPLRIRCGIHSGSVMAGVVGIKMPRYCLFGDTVNTAARMESSSLPMRIQISVYTKSLLDELSMGFEVRHRGRLDIKGKGEMDTFWLLNKAELQLVLPAFNARFDEVEKQKLILAGQYK